jgi:VWFA-related protein
MKSLVAALLIFFSAAFAQSQQQTPPATENFPAQAQGQTSAQAPVEPKRAADGTYTITRNARIVVLDMVVTDHKGNVVTDLKRGDFRVSEADEPQTILNFEAAGVHTVAPTDNINSTSALDAMAPRAPVNIILLDEFNTRFEDMAFARYSLKKFFAKQPGKLSTPTMLIAVDLKNFVVLHDYTQSKDDLLSALNHHFAANSWHSTDADWAEERYETAFVTLRRVAQAVMGHPGHKSMIWIGRGFPSLNLEDFEVDTEERLNYAVQDCINVLRDARITLYTIDPAGVMTHPENYGSYGEFVNEPLGGNIQFSALAKATGGDALYGRNDVDTEIGTTVRDGASFYSLTYRPTDDSIDPQKFRKIKVTVDRPGLIVTTRNGYYVNYGPDPVNPVKPESRLAVDLLAASNSTMVYDSVPVSVRRAPEAPDTFDLMVDGKGLVWSPATDTEPRRAEVVLVASTFDKKGKLLVRDSKIIRAKAAANVPAAGRLDRTLDIHYLLKHDPKATRIRFVVRVASSGRIGTADVDLTQPPAPRVAVVPANGSGQ